MGETRALIGAQWMMFFSSFGAARQASEMVRTMQQLNGSATRYTEPLPWSQKLGDDEDVGPRYDRRRVEAGD